MKRKIKYRGRKLASRYLKAMRVSNPTVFLVDDDDSVRRGLARVIKSHDHHMQTFASARQFLDSDWQNHSPACLVLDVRMPGLSGLDLQRELQIEKAILLIVFITGHGDIPMSVKATKEGPSIPSRTGNGQGPFTRN
jgi:FixJ family two-component response regulator